MPQANPVILRLWAALLLLAAILEGPIPIFTFGVVGFLALFIFWLRDEKDRPARERGVSGLLLALCTVWFALNLLLELQLLLGTLSVRTLQASTLATAFLFPPLIMHNYFLEAGASRLSRWQSGLTIGAYFIGVGSSLYLWGLISGLHSWIPAGIWMFLTLLLFSQFATACLAGGAVMSRRPRTPGVDSDAMRRWNLGLLALMLILFAFLSWQVSWGRKEFTQLASTVCRSLPILFLFVASYFEERFRFFDVFVKKATLCFLGLFVLFAFFGAMLPALSELPVEAQPWVLALTLLPLLLATPFLARLVEDWLDRAWLGRRFETVEAVAHAMEGLRHATSVGDLVREAEKRLGTILQGPVRIWLDPDDPRPLEWPVVEEVQIPSYGAIGGTILLGVRRNQTPYFTQDLTLVRALATVIAYLLENFRLQQHRRVEEQRAQQLQLSASRSELKALRAQINPHFLFNALNAIAGLIPEDPGRAEATIEELAGVFRYTLSRSESEWVKVRDELDFVSSYLEVERARFGERLQIQIDVDPALVDAAIPMMLIQTLVENGVKHGLSQVRGVGRIRVAVKRDGNGLRVQVADNGPDPETPSRKPFSSPGTGFGLESVRRRLKGYFGDEATFHLGRDASAGETVAQIRMPLRHPDDLQPEGAG